MTKKFTLIALLILLAGTVSFSQTAVLPNDTASPGKSIIIPLNVTNWTNIAAITLHIRFNPSILSFVGISNTAAPNFLADADSAINIVWTAPVSPATYLTIANGKLLDLNFVYTGPGTSALTFITSGSLACEVVQSTLVPVPVAYTNGSVGPNLLNTHTASLPPQTNKLAGDVVNLPIVYQGFPSNVGSLTQNIHFDVTKLTYTGYSTAGVFATTPPNVSVNNGLVAITWSKTSGANINYSLSNFIQLNFVYTGSTMTTVEFFPGSLITTNTATNISVTYNNATVSPGVPSSTATLGSISGILQGQDFEVPLNLAGLPSGVNGTGAFTLSLTYDNPRLSFIGLTNLSLPAYTTIYSSGNTITIAYSNPTIPTPNINGLFLKLKFKYNGIGIAHVNFGSGCLFSYITGGTIPVGYTHSVISPGPGVGTATIGYVSTNSGTDVLVPVSFNIPGYSNIGAVTLNIDFDRTKLTFIGAVNNTHNANVSLNGNLISIAWNSLIPLGENINGNFLDLKFHYSGSGSAAVNFTDGCEVSAIVAPASIAIVPLDWIHGGVNFTLGYKISGILAYNSAPNTDIPLTSVTVFLKTNPGNVLVASTTTDGTGYFQFLLVPNGLYTLDASTSKAWGGVNTIDAQRVFAYASSGGATPLPNQNALRLQAADVNLSGTINTIDAQLIFSRQATGIKPGPYSAADWFFGDINVVPSFPLVPAAILPVVTVSGADVVKNFWGLCSGDVNGSYSPIP
jgi:hypothetical protein